MPGGFPFLGNICNPQIVSANLASTLGPAVAGNVSANTKGSWVQLIASTTSDISVLQINFPCDSSANPVSVSVDIGVGGAGAEKVLIADLLTLRQSSNVYSTAHFLLPVNIPAGTRIAARSQGSVGSLNAYMTVIGYDGGFVQSKGVTSIDTIGFLSASTLGTAIDPGASANTKGAYGQLTAATPQDYWGFILAIDKQNSSTHIDALYYIDIAVGAAASEQVVLSNFAYAAFAAFDSPVWTSNFYPIAIPSGSRVAARCQANNNATPRTIGITLYGVNA